MIAPDGPDSVLSSLEELRNPRRALERLYELVDGLVSAVESSLCDTAGCSNVTVPLLYMGEKFEVWLDSWRDVRRELRKPLKDKSDKPEKAKKKKDKPEKDKKDKPEKDTGVTVPVYDGFTYDLSKIPEIFDKARRPERGRDQAREIEDST